MSVVPWKRGKLPVWDVMCPDTIAYAALALVEVGTVAAHTEERKMQSKYLHLATNHIFTPVAIETSGVFGPESMIFVHELGHALNGAGYWRSKLPPVLVAATLPLPFSGAIRPLSCALPALLTWMTVVPF